MEKFNLLKEPWIAVLIDEQGTTSEVSLIDAFKNAHKYKGLAGETQFQNFALLRLLLAVMHTVFSRFNDKGEVYSYFELDEMYKQCSVIEDEYDIEDYCEDLLTTWKGLWDSEKLPEIIELYLRKWEDSFDFYSDDKPFYQIPNDFLVEKGINEDGTSYLKPQFLNRLISESDNTVKLFSPNSHQFKNDLSDSELVRWVVTFQGYTGTSEKKKHPDFKGSSSKGWLLGLGGVYYEGKNLKETLLLNLVMDETNAKEQTPVWEKTNEKIVEDIFNGYPNNLADLYTFYSRLMLVDKKRKKMSEKKEKDKYIRTVQMPGIKQNDYFLEQMTMWKFEKNGENKDSFIPLRHQVEHYFWESFGNASVARSSSNMKRVGLFDWHSKLIEKGIVDNDILNIVAVGVNYNKDASTMMNEEINDYLSIDDYVLIDIQESGWIYRIEAEITLIKYLVDKILGSFLNDLAKLNNSRNNSIASTIKREAYFQINKPFREWLTSLKVDDQKDEKVSNWRSDLKKILLEQGKKMVSNPSNREYKGIVTTDSKNEVVNIVTLYNKYVILVEKYCKEGVKL